MKKIVLVIIALVAFNASNAQVTKAPKPVWERVNGFAVQIAIVEDSLFYMRMNSDNQFDEPAIMTLGVNAEMAYEQMLSLRDAAKEKENFYYKDIVGKEFRFVYSKFLDYYMIKTDGLAGKSSLTTPQFDKALKIIKKYYDAYLESHPKPIEELPADTTKSEE